MIPGILFAVATNANLVDLAGDTLSDVSLDPTNASVGYRINTSGAEESYEGVGAGYSSINTWLNEGSASDYSVRLTVNSGTTPSGDSTGVWLALTSSRAWTLDDTSTAGGPITNNLTVDLALTADTANILASATVTMSVEKTA